MPEPAPIGGSELLRGVARQVADAEELQRALDAFWLDYHCQRRRGGKLSALVEHYRRLADYGPADEYLVALKDREKAKRDRHVPKDGDMVI